MKTFAQWVIALTRGYIKATGKEPDKLAKLKINMEAGQKVRDQEKVIKVDFGKKSSPWYTDPKIITPEEELRREFPGISDDLIKNILADDNPQRIAEVKATMHEAMKMQEKGMPVDEIINIFKKKPTKHASGGLAGMLGE